MRLRLARLLRAFRPPPEPEPPAPEIAALARTIAERNTGMPAYLVDDEAWAAAEAEAIETYTSPNPETPMQAAIRRAQGRLSGDEVVAAIEAYNAAQRGEINATVVDHGDGSYTVTREPALSPLRDGGAR